MSNFITTHEGAKYLDIGHTILLLLIYFYSLADGGQNKFCIVLHILDRDNPGGVDQQGLKATGVRRGLVLLECDAAVENYENMQKLFSLLDLPSLQEPFKFTADYKLLRIMLGLSGGQPRHPCPYCIGEHVKATGEVKAGIARTLGFCKDSYNNFVKKAQAKTSKAKEFFNCVRPPVELMSGMDDVWILAIMPPGPLHTILLGSYYFYFYL